MGMANEMKGGPMNVFRRAGKVFRSSVLCVLGILILVEVGLRMYYTLHPKPSAPSGALDYSYELVGPVKHVRLSPTPGRIKLVYHPHLTYKNLPDQHTEWYHVNSLGLRGTEVAPLKED